MDHIRARQKFLEQAKVAEETAAKAKDEKTKIAWLEVAKGYRELAAGK